MGISLADFYFLNPNIDFNYTNLLAGSAYCVKAAELILAYENYSGESHTQDCCLATSVPFTSFCDSSTLTPVPYIKRDDIFSQTTPATPTMTARVKAISSAPLAPGTFTSCQKDQEYRKLVFSAGSAADLEAGINSCHYVMHNDEISMLVFMT